MMDDERNRRMGRRAFLSGMPAAAALCAAATPKATRAQTAGVLTAGSVHQYLRSLDGGWVDWEKSVDTFKAGTPATPVKGIAVGWMPYTATLQQTLDLGCNVFVTHEPTYYNHRDNDPDIFRFPAVQAKREFIEQNGLVIMRCHDVWDQYPEIGIPTGWGTLLDLGEPIEGAGWYYVYDGKGMTARIIARRIAELTASRGQPAVQLIGPGEKRVHRIVLGTGAITPMFHFIENLAADMAICTDDGFTYWRDGAYAIDAGFPVAVVNHPVSEDYPMKLLADHLRARFPQVPVHNILQRCMYTLVTAEGD